MTRAGDAIENVARYMIYRQLPNGLFSYQYEPSADVYIDDDNLVRQAGGRLALAVHARVYDKSASAAAAEKAIKGLAGRAVDLPNVDQAAFIAGRAGEHKLGHHGAYRPGYVRPPRGRRQIHRTSRQADQRGLLAAVASGKFVTAFPSVAAFSVNTTSRARP